jgi:hypothetical protein
MHRNRAPVLPSLENSLRVSDFREKTNKAGLLLRPALAFGGKRPYLMSNIFFKPVNAGLPSTGFASMR